MNNSDNIEINENGNVNGTVSADEVSADEVNDDEGDNPEVNGGLVDADGENGDRDLTINTETAFYFNNVDFNFNNVDFNLNNVDFDLIGRFELDIMIACDDYFNNLDDSDKAEILNVFLERLNLTINVDTEEVTGGIYCKNIFISNANAMQYLNVEQQSILINSMLNDLMKEGRNIYKIMGNLEETELMKYLEEDQIRHLYEHCQNKVGDMSTGKPWQVSEKSHFSYQLKKIFSQYLGEDV